MTAKRILVLDDEDHIGALFREYLTREGYEVHVFNQPETAYESAVSLQYDLFLLDFSMPTLDGDRFYEMVALAIKEQNRAGDSKTVPPFILVTGFDWSPDSDRIQQFVNRAQSIIHKPFDLEELRLRVEAVFNR